MPRRALGVNNGNSRHAREARRLEADLLDRVKADEDAWLANLKAKQLEVYLELLRLDPEGAEAWYDDDNNVPAWGTIRERIQIIESRIAELKEARNERI